MAALILFRDILNADERRSPRRNRIFRDRSQVLDTLTDIELVERYRFPRFVILQLTDDVKDLIQPNTRRSYSIPAHIQVFLGEIYAYSTGMKRGETMTRGNSG